MAESASVVRFISHVSKLGPEGPSDLPTECHCEPWDGDLGFQDSLHPDPITTNN